MTISAPVLDRKFLLEVDGSHAYGVPWPIKVFDDGDPDFLTVQYPDNAWQKQPRSWWADKLRRAGVKPPEAPAPVSVQPRIALRPRPVQRIALRPQK